MKRSIKFGASLAGISIAIYAVFCLGILQGGCNDDDDLQGNAILKGNVVSFESTAVQARVAAAVPGVMVHIAGPVTRSTTTDESGVFIFFDLLGGEYGLRFEYNGQSAAYRDASGETAQITIEDNHQVELRDIRIAGGQMRIGSINMQQETQQPGDHELASTIWYSGAKNVEVDVSPGLPLSVPLDVDSDGTTDYEFYSEMDELHFSPQLSNRAVGPNASGVVISSDTGGWSNTRLHMFSCMTLPGGTEPPYQTLSCLGPWYGVTNAYMGLEFVIDGITHYGWARITEVASVCVTVHDWAYETRPGVGIKAGQVK